MNREFSRGYPQPPPESQRHAHGSACPRCGGATYRVSRHFMDRVISALILVHRYRCWSIECGWEGRRRVRPTAPKNAGQR